MFQTAAKIIRFVTLKSTRAAGLRPLLLACAAVIGGATTAQAFVYDSAVFCDGLQRSVSDDFVRNVQAGDTFIFEGGDFVSLFIDGAFVFDLSRTFPFAYTITAVDAGKDAEFRADGRADISCTRVATPPATGAEPSSNAAAQISLTVQAGVTQSAISANIAGRFGGGGFAVGPSNVFVSTRSFGQGALEQPELNAWLAFDSRQFSGTSTGSSRNLTFGMDRLVTPEVVLGGFIGVNDQTVTTGGVTTDTTAPLVGIYGAQNRQQDVFLSGFLAYGRPTYRTGGAQFTSSRMMFGAAVDGSLETGALKLQPSLTVLASTERLPKTGSTAADTLKNVQTKIALRAEPRARMKNGMLPYINLAAEYRMQGSDLAGVDRFLQPRIGLGLDWALAAGVLRVDLDYGSVTSDTQDLGLAVVYDFKF